MRSRSDSTIPCSSKVPRIFAGEAGSSIDRPLLPRRSHLPPCAAQSCARHKELKAGIVDLIGRDAARHRRRMRATRCENKNHVARDVAGGTACTCRRGFSFLTRSCDGQGRLVSSARAVSRLLLHVTRGKPTGSRGTCTELRCVQRQREKHLNGPPDAKMVGMSRGTMPTGSDDDTTGEFPLPGPDGEARGELPCCLVVAQLLARASSGSWLRTDHLVESARI